MLYQILAVSPNLMSASFVPSSMMFNVGLNAGISLADSSLFYPVDAVRVRILLGRYQSPIGASNGIVFNAGSTMAKRFSLYPVQDYCEKRFSSFGMTPQQTLVTSSLVTGAISSLFCIPIGLIKVNLQAQSGLGVNTFVQDLWKKQGLRGFYKGGLPMAFREGVFTQTYFNTYDYLNKRLDSKTPYHSYIATGVAGGAAGFASFIPDCIRTTMQANCHQYSLRESFRHIFPLRGSNLACLGISVARTSLSMMFTHNLYNTFKKTD